MNAIIIIAVIILAVGFYAMTIFNTLQRLKTQIEASIQEIGNQLKRQAMLIPSLESAVKGHLKQEKTIFGMLTDARKAVSNAQESNSGKDLEKAIDNLSSIVPKLSIAIEDNPELKSDVTISRFMAELSDTADKLMYARRTVIDLTQSYNEKLVTFPSNMIANAFGFTAEKGIATPREGAHMEVSESEMKDHKVDL